MAPRVPGPVGFYSWSESFYIPGPVICFKFITVWNWAYKKYLWIRCISTLTLHPWVSSHRSLCNPNSGAIIAISLKVR